MINTQLKLIFVDIPKTGSTAFKNFLVRGFHNFTWHATTNPSWVVNFCPECDKYLINSSAKVERAAFTRHEPLISKYLHVSGIEKYFIFTIVRDPFERFKSAFLEAILHNRHGIKQQSITNPTKYTHQNLQDPWYINSHYNMNNYYNSIPSEELQAKMIFNQLNIIAAKGGFEKTGVCDVPHHFWPQYIFTSLTLPSPLNVTTIKYENLNTDFPILKQELSYITGVDVTKEELPFSDPIANAIFSHFNPEAVDTMGYKFKIEKETSRDPRVNFDFVKKYPTFDDYLPVFKEEKQQVTEHWLPTLENHRDIIEHLYAEDYRLHGYSPKS